MRTERRSFYERIFTSPSLCIHEVTKSGEVIKHTAADLKHHVERWQAYYDQHHLHAGSRILFPANRNIDAIAALLAAWKNGIFTLLVKPSNPIDFMRNMAQEIEADAMILDPAKARLMVRKGLASDAAEAGEHYHICKLHRTARLLKVEADLGILTSGTTGNPRVVLHSLDRVLQNAGMHAASIGLRADHRVALTLALNFSYGLVAGLLGALKTQATLVLFAGELPAGADLPTDARFDVTMTTPFNAEKFVNARTEYPDLELLTVGGDVLNVVLARDILTANPQLTLMTTYGLSEAGPRVATCHITHDLLDRFSAIPLGKPLDGVKLTIDRKPGHLEGELVVESPTLMLGYMSHPAETQRIIQHNRLRTGDMFTMKNGEFVFAAREKRVIFHGGEKIYPALVENEILKSGMVRDVWVTSEPCIVHGMAPKAYMVADTQPCFRTLEKHLRKNLPRSGVPVSWQVVTALPANARK